MFLPFCCLVTPNINYLLDIVKNFSSYVVKCQKSFILLQSLVFKFQNSKCIECLCVERMSFHVVFISDTLKVVMGKLNFCVHP
jgi:hypothetical protein